MTLFLTLCVDMTSQSIPSLVKKKEKRNPPIGLWEVFVMFPYWDDVNIIDILRLNKHINKQLIHRENDLRTSSSIGFWFFQNQY